jgi:hypothetical protein
MEVVRMCRLGGEKEAKEWGPETSSHPSTHQYLTFPQNPQVSRLTLLEGMGGKKVTAAVWPNPAPSMSWAIWGELSWGCYSGPVFRGWGGREAKEKHVFIT